MPLLLNQDDLQPLLSSPEFYPRLFDVIRNSLLRQHDDQPGDVSWLAFPTSQPQTFWLSYEWRLRCARSTHPGQRALADCRLAE